MKIERVTVRANREWAPFQHARVEVVASFNKSHESLDDITNSVTSYLNSVLDNTCHRLLRQTAPTQTAPTENKPDELPY